MPDNPEASHSRPSTKLRDILNLDKPTLSYADFHHQITGNAGRIMPKTFGSQQSHGTEGKGEQDELVRYMSNLPSYLEKGKNFQEKPLNVGVLDWRRLEKWKHSNGQMPRKTSGYASSTTSTSYFSTEGSSAYSSRGQSSSPARQRLQRSSLQSHLEASPVKNYSHDKLYSGRGHSNSPAHQTTCSLVPHSHHQIVYSWEGCSPNVVLIKENSAEFEGKFTSIPDHRIREQNRCGMGQTWSTKESGVGLEMHKKKELNSTTTSEIGKQQIWGNSDVASPQKGKLKIRESELKEAMWSRHNLGDHKPDCSKERQTVVLLMPRDPAKNGTAARSSDASSSANRMPKECGGRCSSEQDTLKKVHGSDVSSSAPYTFPLPLQEDNKKKPEMRESRPTSTLAVKASSQQLKSPPRSRNTEEKTSIVVLKSSTAANISGQLDNRTGSQPTTKVRHSSPIRRLGSAMGNIIRSAGSRDNSPLRRSISNDSVAKPSLDRAATSVSLNTDTSQANGRARSSPLRRLLDPLIKPKATSVYELSEPLRKDSALIAGPRKSFDGQYNLPKAQSVKVKSTFTKGAKDSHQSANRESSTVQALLQVAIKNGLPLYTFAVDNVSDNILAATLRKGSAAEKNRSSWIYTFLDVHEMKKKNALWPNHGSKGKGKGKGHYVPNVVAQMTVSDRQDLGGMKQNGADGDTSREFTLFSVDVGQADQHTTEFQPTDELAAIVVKPLKASAGHSSDMSIISPSPMNTIVILPGGVHTIPSKGSISTLTERWRSGGSCDCGGWDLGCQLRIFTNQGDSQKFLCLSKANNASDEFKLYRQVGQENELVFSLNPFKDRIYSAEFDSSVSLLQAFATSIAVLDCRRSSGIFGTSNVIDGRSFTTSVSEDPARTKELNQSYLEAPASYVSCPPHSPVRRA